MELGSYGQAAGQGLFESSTTAKHSPGELFVCPDGRRFRYAKAGALLVAGNVLQSPAEITTHQNLVVVTGAINSYTPTVTLGATNAVTANQYAGGWVFVTVTPNLGGYYQIKSHPAAAALANLTLELSDPIRVAWNTSTRVDIVGNIYINVIQSPATTLSGVTVGVAPWAIPSGEWGWIQVGGMAPVLVAGTIAVGAMAIVPSGTAGAAVTDPANASVIMIGQAVSATASGETNAINLNIS